MKNVDALIRRAVSQCNAVGIKTGRIVRAYSNSRAKSRWGNCHRNPNGTYVIQISAVLLADSVDDMATMNTVVHEVLHTCAGCMNHGVLWKHYAEIMNRNYGYHIKRTNSAEELGVPNDRVQTAKFVIRCNSCGHLYYYQRESKVVKLIKANGTHSGCRCHCGSHNLEVL